MPSRDEELVAIFRQLGARSPEDWARSEAQEGIPQLLRFLFLRGAWKSVVSEEDTTWTAASISSARAHPHAPLSGTGAALGRILAAGAATQDVVDLVRGMQYETLFAIAYLLDDPTRAFDDMDEAPAAIANTAWGLWEESEDGVPVRRIGSLHEDALGMDPTGREMRPRKQ